MITKTTVKEPDTLVELLSARASQRPDHRTYTFPVPEAGTGIVEKEWAIHEVETTSNFGTRNRLANWYLGGLNFQIEHHLFPHVCHVHYPAISRIVEETCREFSIPYVAYPTARGAVAAHFRFLKALGAPSVAPLPLSPPLVREP